MLFKKKKKDEYIDIIAGFQQAERKEITHDLCHMQGNQKCQSRKAEPRCSFGFNYI